MNEMDEKKIVMDKIEFYRVNEIKAHVFIIPKPRFKNGLFVSKLQTGNYYWFIENKTSMPVRLFLSEIVDIEDYLPEEETMKEIIKKEKESKNG